MTDEEAKNQAGKKIVIAMRSRRPLAAYARTEDLKEIFLDLLTTTAVWCGNISEDDAVTNFRNCLRWVRGDESAEAPKAPEQLN